jgi:hypothetical protein
MGTGGGTGAGGGSGSASCSFNAQCLSLVSWGSRNGLPGCPNGMAVLPTFKNVCSSIIACKICRPGNQECTEFWYDPGETVGGWSAYGWCNSSTELEWRCAVDVAGVSLSQCVRQL